MAPSDMGPIFNWNLGETILFLVSRCQLIDGYVNFIHEDALIDRG